MFGEFDSVMEATYISSDTYAETRRKFNAAWPNLRLEIHWSDTAYYKEGMNEVEPDRTFTVEGQPVKSFTLTDDTTIMAAKDLFKNFGEHEHQLAVNIIDNLVDKWVSPIGSQTLAAASDPFILRPVEFTYAEFQRRFTERWPNLSIRFFQIESGGELPSEFELKTLTGTGIRGLLRSRVYVRNGVYDTVEMTTDNYLHDHLYISDYKNALEKTGIQMTIKNTRTGTEWDRDSSPQKIIDFQNA